MIFRKKNKDLTDLELVYRYQKTLNTNYVGALFERYGHLVFGVALKYLQDQDDSKDAVSRIFEKLLNDLKRMKITHFKSWLYTVAKNHCLMELRKKPESRSIEVLENSISVDEAPNRFHAKELQLTSLEKAITQLKDHQRLCIELFYLKEMSYQLIATKTNFSFKEVKSHIQNGKRNLKQILERDMQFNTSSKMI